MRARVDRLASRRRKRARAANQNVSNTSATATYAHAANPSSEKADATGATNAGVAARTDSSGNALLTGKVSATRQSPRRVAKSSGKTMRNGIAA